MRIRKCSFIVAAAAAAAVGLSAPRASAVTPVTAIAIEGQTLPGSGAATVTTVNTAFVSGNNKVGFLGILSDNARFIYFDNGIVFKSTDVPSPVLTGGEGSIGVSDSQWLMASAWPNPV